MLEQKIQGDYVKAMKDRDQVKAGTLSFLRAQLKNVMIDKRQDTLSDADVVVIIKKQVKQRQESIAQFDQGSRKDLADKERAEIEILKIYLPEEMTAEAIQPLVAEAIKEIGATSVKEMGQVMKAVMAKTAGRADNKIVSECVKNILSGM